MAIPMPAIDQNAVTSWNEQEQTLYNSYPFWLAKYEVAHRKTYATHSRLTGKRKWERNHGTIMRGVRKEPSPHLRQEATPQELYKVPQKDIIDVHEMIVETTLKRHRFESRVIPFYPVFNDFLRDHLSFEGQDIISKRQRFEDLFVRVCAFHQASNVFVANAATEVITGPMWDGKDVAQLNAQGKNQGWRQATLATLGAPGNLSIVNCFLADSYLREDVRAVAWSDGGSGMPKDDNPMPGKNILCLSNEAYNQFRFDPFLLDNRRIDLDIVQHGFKGSIGDNITCRIEDLPLRMAQDGTFPAPEQRVVNNDAYNKGESVLKDAYKDAPYEFAFLYAADALESLEVGAPPSEFTGQTIPKGFADMFWNGEVRWTKLFNIPYLDETGAVFQEFNTYGEHLKAICQVVLGVLATQRRNVLPILFKRVRGAA